MALVLGVTGSIATGKSYLCQYLVSNYDAIHADADKVVHRMYDPGKPGFDRIVTEFGETVIGSDGFIDRKQLGAQVFGNTERMADLTRAIGDIAAEMEQIIENWRAELPRDGIAVLEAVNLIEAGYSKWCDATWLVAVENEVALPRLMQRNSFSESEAQQRLDSQRSWEKRAPASDMVFHNDTDLQNFQATIDAQIVQTMELFDGERLPKTRWYEWRATQDAEDAKKSE
jgi:dephospho-CoA kinase